MVKMPNNDGESEESEKEMNSSNNSSDSEMESDDSSSSILTENELKIGKKISDYNEILCKTIDVEAKLRNLNFYSLSELPADLEKQFAVLREDLYKERIKQVDMQLHEIDNGTSQEYLAPLQELADRMNARKEVAEILKKYRLENIRHKYESEEQAARQNYESEKQLSVDKLIEELNEKIRRLEEDSHNVDISWAEWGSSSKINKVRGPGKKKPVTVQGPFIVYMLHDEEIMEDWTIIKKAIKGTSNTTNRVHQRTATASHA